MTSCSTNFGDLKMVKVKRGRRGRQKSRSLVFRISRSTSKSGSNVKDVDSTSSKIISSEKSFLENHPESLKIKIPKILLQNESKESENVPTVFTQNLAAQKHVETSVDLNSSLEYVRTEDPNCSELRRSSRRIFLKLQKDSKQDSFTNKSTNINQELSSAQSSCSKITGERKKRGRKTGYRVLGSDLKKRKYTRRGRPPKLTLPRNFRVLKPVCPGGSQNESSNHLLKAPKNSVWTLIPKELFESEFFKSHVRKVQFTNPFEKNESQLIASEPSIYPTSFSNAGNEKTRKRMQDYVQQKCDEDKEYKRPTVIYFRNENRNFKNSSDHHRDYRNSQIPYENQYCNSGNRVPYSFKRYHGMNDLTVTNYYGGSLSSVVSVATSSLQRNYHATSEKESSNYEAKRNCSGHLVCNLNVNTAPVSRVFDSTGISSSEDNIDILTRCALVESLRVLYDKEAVL